MECMVNSDNVVRGGLTPKLKDTATLCEILPYASRSEPSVALGRVKQASASFEVLEYLTRDFPELCLLRVTIKPETAETVRLETFPFLAICVVLSGHGKVTLRNEALSLQTEQDIDVFSTWYVSPCSQLGIEISAGSAEPLVIFIATPSASV